MKEKETEKEERNQCLRGGKGESNRKVEVRGGEQRKKSM